MKQNHDLRIGVFRRNEKLEALLKEVNGLLSAG